MPRFDSFTGPSNFSIHPNVAYEVTVNWIPERNPIPVVGEGVTDKNVRCSLIPRPGLQLFTQLPNAPCRGVFPGEYRLFAVGGDRYYEVFSDGSVVDRCVAGFVGSSGQGPAPTTIGNDGKPVQWFANGHQVLLISAGQAYCDNGNGPVPCVFSDPLNNLTINPTNNFALRIGPQPVSGPIVGGFDASDVGRTIRITAGFSTGFGAGDNLIVAVNAGGEALGQNAWGVAGGTLGAGILFAKQLAITDLQTTNPNVVHSPTYPFGASDVGAILFINSGAGFSPGRYTITGLVTGSGGQPTGDAIVDRPCGIGAAFNGQAILDAAPVTASYGAFLDGYFFATPSPRSKSVFFSAINDGTVWDNLSFFVKANYPDNVAALFADHEELYTFGLQESTQIFRDTGNADNPFMPDQGAVMHVGCMAPYSVVRLGNGVAWIGGDTRRGQRKAYHATGYNPVVVSTPEVEKYWWNQSNDVSDAVAFTYMQSGHELWVINFGNGDQTWVYDATTGWWSLWGQYDGTFWFHRFAGWVHCVVALGKATNPTAKEQHYVGDWQNGNIYLMGHEYRTDNGQIMVRRRWCPHMTVENQRRFYSRFEIDCDTRGTPPNERIFWNRLGYGRDRIWTMDVRQSAEGGPISIFLGFSDDNVQTFTILPPYQIATSSVDLTLSNAYLRWVDATWN